MIGTSRPLFIPVIIVILVGCQDDISSKPTNSSDKSIEDQGQEDLSRYDMEVNQPDLLEQDQSKETQYDLSVVSDISETGEEIFTREQLDSIDEPGEWAGVDVFTIIPGYDFDEVDVEASLCPVSASSTSLTVVRIIERVGLVLICSEDPTNPYGSPYTHYKVERMLHLAGERMPLYFDVKKFGGPTRIEENKTYILGTRVLDGTVFGNPYVHEIIEYDESMESNRVHFSGKREAIIALGGEQLNNFGSRCPHTLQFESDAEYRDRYLYLDPSRCDN